MTRQQFKTRWDSDSQGGGITFDDIAKCAKTWGLYTAPKTQPIEQVRYAVLCAADVADKEDFKPQTDEDTCEDQPACH